MPNYVYCVFSKSGEVNQFDNEKAALNYCQQTKGMMQKFVAGSSQIDLVSNSLAGKLEVKRFY
jgi:hypothetical protein